MKDDKYDQIKELLQKAGPFRIGVVVLCGILLLIISCGNIFDKKSEKTDAKAVQEQQEQGDTLEGYRVRMENQVKSILSKAEGINDVDVMITLKSSGEKVTLKDNTVNADKSEEETVLVEDEEKKTLPYVVKEDEPEIEGILVVCEGGNQPTIQREIIDGISALFPVESHKIKVMKSKEAKE